jgi:hypothetical protein
MKSKYFKKETVIQFKTIKIHDLIGMSQLIVFQNLFMTLRIVRAMALISTGLVG